MVTTMNHTTVLVVEECCTCHVTFGIPRTWQESLKQTHAIFYCPAGHGQSYNGKTDVQKLREKLAETEQYRRNLAERTEYAEAALRAKQDQLEATERSLRGHKAAKTRIKNRIAAGVCPCCNRQFQNLHRHMTGQHPDFPSTTDKSEEKSK